MEGKMTDQEFWEKCGFEVLNWTSLNPDGTERKWIGDRDGVELQMTLDNLFKWAVPKLDDMGYVFILYRFFTLKIDFKTPDEYGYGVKIYKYGVDEGNIRGLPNEDPAQALKKAMEGVL